MANLPQIKSTKDLFTFSNFLLYKTYYRFFGKFLEEKARKKGEIIYQSSFGFKVNLKLDRVVDRYFYIGSFEKETFSFFKKLVKPNMTIIDIGGNIGLFSLTASATMDDSGKIYAFEPAEEVFNDFQKNIELNNFKNIQLIKKGVADKSGEISFNICEDNAYNSINLTPMNKIVRKITIKTVSLDDFCAKEEIKKIDIIKIDTEGAEFMVLKGGEKTLTKEDAPILIMEYNRFILSEAQLSDIRNILTKYGYNLWELRYGVIQPFDSSISSTVDLICLKAGHEKNILSY